MLWSAGRDESRGGTGSRPRSSDLPASADDSVVIRLHGHEQWIVVVGGVRQEDGRTDTCQRLGQAGPVIAVGVEAGDAAVRVLHDGSASEVR